MTQFKHTIIYMIVFCLFFLVMSYIVSVNKELAICSANSVWVPKDFLLSCFTGIFASFMVLIATEVYKFFQMKRSMEQRLYEEMATIYGQLHIAENGIQNLLSSNERMPTNLLHYLSKAIRQMTAGMRTFDYNPMFKGKNTRIIIRIIQRLQSAQLNRLESLANDCIYLEMAIIADNIKGHENGVLSPIITSGSPNTNKTLIALLKEIQSIKPLITTNLAELNAACENRFHWSEFCSQTSSLHTIAPALEDFWAKWDQSTQRPM